MSAELSRAPPAESASSSSSLSASSDSVSSVEATQLRHLTLPIPFSGSQDDWRFWKAKFIAHLSQVKLDKVLKIPSSSPSTSSSSSSIDAAQNDKVYAFLILCINKDLFNTFVAREAEGDAAKVWAAMTAFYERKSMVSVHAVRSSLEADRMKEGESVLKFATRLRNAAARYAELASPDKISNAELIRFLFRSLPPAFAQITTTLRNRDDSSKLDFEEVVRALVDEEENMKDNQSAASSSSTALYVTGYIDSCYIGKAKLYYCCIISSANCL